MDNREIAAVLEEMAQRQGALEEMVRAIHAHTLGGQQSDGFSWSRLGESFKPSSTKAATDPSSSVVRALDA